MDLFEAEISLHKGTKFIRFRAFDLTDAYRIAQIKADGMNGEVISVYVYIKE